MLNLLEQCGDQAPSSQSKQLEQALDHWQKDVPQRDDITVWILQVKATFWVLPVNATIQALPIKATIKALLVKAILQVSPLFGYCL